jgi:predicted transporter
MTEWFIRKLGIKKWAVFARLLTKTGVTAQNPCPTTLSAVAISHHALSALKEIRVDSYLNSVHAPRKR